MKVVENLQTLIELYRERSKTYGNNYREHGNVMVAFFPEGITLTTSDDFNRYSCFKEIATRLGRYARNFDKGGHADSLNDIAVYSQMLQEMDSERQE